MERFGNSALQFSSSRQRETKTEAFSIQPLALLPLLRPGGSLFFGLQTLAFSIQPLAFVSAAGWENVAEIIGKFGGADQLRNEVTPP